MSNDELAAEVREIRHDLDALTERADIEAGLRAATDRDLGNLEQKVTAIHRTVQALAVTQSEHTRTLALHTDILAQHTKILNQHSAALVRLESGLVRLETGQQTIVMMLDRLITDSDRD